MGNNRPITASDWRRFLEAHGCRQKRHNKTSHEHWKCPKCLRTIVFRNQYKEIPPFHLKTNLQTMGKTLSYLYDWLEKN